MKMRDNRIVKQALNEMTKDYWKYKWIKDVKKYCKQYHLEWEEIETATDHKGIKQKMIHEDLLRLAMKQIITNKETLKHYTADRVKLGCEQPYMGSGNAAKAFCYARVNDIWSITKQNEMDVCLICQQPVVCIWRHIINRCPKVIGEKQKPLRFMRRNNHIRKSDDIDCTRLNTGNKQIGLALGGVIHAWKQLAKK